MVASARVLTDAFRDAFYGEDIQDKPSGKKKHDLEMDLDDAMKRVNESVKDKDDMEIIDSVFVELNKAYYDKHVHKARELMK